MQRKKTGDEGTKKSTTQRKSATPRRRTTRASARVGSKSVAAAAVSCCTDDQVRERAYYIFLERQDIAGNPADDWFQAERELNGVEAAK